jgi:uncharacterized membrane protein YedE/YeeE
MGKTKYLGASTTFVRAAAMAENVVVPGHVSSNEYYQKNKPQMDWQFMLVIGILIGAFGASLADGSFRRETVPPIWRSRFGNKIGVRAVGAILGGIVAMFGARLAGGCPSGHGMSGLMQLSLSGFLAMVGFFAGGVAVANLVYRGGGARQ